MKQNTAYRLKKYFSGIINNPDRLFIEPCENNNGYYFGLHDSYDCICLWGEIDNDSFRCMSYAIRDFNYETK